MCVFEPSAMLKPTSTQETSIIWPWANCANAHMFGRVNNGTCVGMAMCHRILDKRRKECWDVHTCATNQVGVFQIEANTWGFGNSKLFLLVGCLEVFTMLINRWLNIASSEFLVYSFGLFGLSLMSEPWWARNMPKTANTPYRILWQGNAMWVNTCVWKYADCVAKLLTPRSVLWVLTCIFEMFHFSVCGLVARLLIPLNLHCQQLWKLASAN